MERQAIETEREEVSWRIRELRGLIEDPKKVDRVIREEFVGLQKTYGDARRTRIVRSDRFEEEEEPAERGPTLVLMTQRGYLSRFPAEQWAGSDRRKLERPKGDRKRSDPIAQIISVMPERRVAGITSRRRIFGIDLDQVPERDGQERGVLLSQFYALEEGERLVAIVPQPEAPEEGDRSLRRLGNWRKTSYGARLGHYSGAALEWFL